MSNKEMKETFRFHTESQTILADLYTPVGVYMRLRDLYAQSALMESSDYHDQSHSRSFIGIDPIASVAVGHGVATIHMPDGTTAQHDITHDFTTADALLTNFHMPFSTMLMIACAFGGYEQVMQAYKVAIDEKYQFGCYGDAMLIVD